MKKFLSLQTLRDIRPRYFFLFLFLYQFLLTFQGLDLSDEGFYGTFYQQVYNDPESIQYCFMFWFSGIVGGAWNAIFGDLGLWGLRLFSALLTTGTIILAYNLLKKYLDKGPLMIGLIIALVFVNTNTKVFHYNYLSCFIYTLTITLLFNGIKDNRPGKLFFAGALVALDAFTRLPSIVNLGLGVAIFYYGFLNKVVFRKQLVQALSFGSGFVVMVAAILGIMKATGHYDIFMSAVNLVRKMGSGGEESHYGIGKLLKQFLGTYKSALTYTIAILMGLFFMTLIIHFASKKSFYRRWPVNLAKLAFVGLMIAVILMGYVDHILVLYFLTGISLISGVFILLSKASKELKILALMGCYIVVTYPLGSSAGLFIVGHYTFWIALPIATDYLFKVSSVENRIQLFGKTPLKGFVFANASQFRQVRKYTVIIVVIACLYNAYYWPFFDKHERTQMTHGISNKYLKLIYTTNERATVVNEVLEESKKYLKPGDYLFAYHSIPMLNYATETVPYAHNSMPWFYEASVLKEELDAAVVRTKQVPVIIAQKVKTVGNASEWPDTPVYYDSAWHKRNIPRDSVLNIFLTEHQYKEVWSNKVFRILVPGGK